MCTNRVHIVPTTKNTSSSTWRQVEIHYHVLSHWQQHTSEPQWYQCHEFWHYCTKFILSIVPANHCHYKTCRIKPLPIITTYSLTFTYAHVDSYTGSQEILCPLRQVDRGYPRQQAVMWPTRHTTDTVQRQLRNALHNLKTQFCNIKAKTNTSHDNNLDCSHWKR